MSNTLLRKIPSVDKILSDNRADELIRKFGRKQVTAVVRNVIDSARQDIKAKKSTTVDDGQLTADDAILNKASNILNCKNVPALSRVINATGIILHTGLGRAVLPPSAINAILSEQSGYSLLEVDRLSGDRTIRETHVVELLKELTDAEAGTAVNNNAGATLIALATFAKGKEVIVSRGQLVEIGGSFRIPEVMEASGAKLIEVGTTNKTYLRDYEKRINENTALLLRVHTSNFRIVGFTETVTLTDLVALGRKHSIPVMDDLGSGAFIDLSQFGIKDEPLVQESVKAGVDIITFSGDKLLGGPQAGIILGKQKYVSQIRKNPLFRALRVDKLTLTALETTLKLFLNKDKLIDEHPTIRMIATPITILEKRAKQLTEKLKAINGFSVEVLDDNSEVGGGSVPAHNLPTKVVAIRHTRFAPDYITQKLRENYPPIFARIKNDSILLDVRTLLHGDDAEIVKALSTISKG